jgi:predicted nucleic acid-binding protein
MIFLDSDILLYVMNNNGKFISNNTKHYENIKGLNLINWLK